ncbi:MAG: NTP transferase domain-containing protein [Thermoplasmata archaeon]
MEPAGRACGALVLSGGLSTRHGGFPKALLPIGGVPAIVRVLSCCLRAGLSPVVAVIRPEFSSVREAIRGLPVRVVASDRCALGRTGSIQAGERELPEGHALFVWPIDRPFAEDKTVRALLSGMTSNPDANWFVPTYGGRGGHPVLLAPAVRDPLRVLDPSAPLRRLRPDDGPELVRVPVPDPSIHWGTDTPEEYRESLERARRSGWTGG